MTGNAPLFATRLRASSSEETAFRQAGQRAQPPGRAIPLECRPSERTIENRGRRDDFRSELDDRGEWRESSGMESPVFSLDGRVAVVTGATRGIGRDVAIAMAAAGATLAVGGRSKSDISAVVETIRNQGDAAIAVEIDVSDIAGIRRAMSDVRDELGSIDVLVNNAGLGANHPAESVTEADWDSMMDVNLKGLFFCCQAAGQIMLEQGTGKIINMSSQAGMVGIAEHAVYSASKGGVNLLTKVLALEWSHRGLNVNAVAPTFIRTPGTAERLDQPDFAASVLQRIPQGRVGTTSDVAGAVIYLASAAADLVNGHILVVDGGWTAQ